MKKAIIYARISTNKEKQNIQQQIDYDRKWALRNEYNIVKVFKDEKTGKTTDRRGYQRMLKYLAENPSVSLIVQDTDRLTRDFYDGVELEKFIRKHKIDLVSISENLVQKIKVGVERAKKEGKFTGRPKGSKNKK